jgi:hypothetical protein
VIAALLPGDAITLLLETLPLYVLYEASILLAAFAWRADAKKRDGGGEPEDHDAGGTTHDPAQETEEPDPTVQQIIDHVDPRLSD